MANTNGFTVNNDADCNGTSFHDVEIYASLDTLVKMFGEPGNDGGYKTKHEWVLERDGIVVTVYDYKYDGSIEGHWHVGGHDRISCLEFARWFQSQKQ